MSRYSTSSTSQTIDNGKKKSLMQDNSWIRRVDDEDDLAELDGETTRSVSSSTSVHSLTKRFTGSQDELRTSSIPSSKTSSSYTKTTYSTEEPRTSTTTTTVTKGGKTTETIITTNQSLKSPGIKSPTTFTERVMSSSRE
uniref:location of vulva defective 1-like n=1 Tax=Monopterus albus TaxID=43700 RepID=UPI0009B40918|nr:location of vulva defective 1-like [Monopterus albus]